MAALIESLNNLIRVAAQRDKAAFLDCLTDDIEYVYHVNARPLSGKVWIEKFLNKYWGEMTDTFWRVDRHAENGNMLLVEGYEEYIIKATGQKVCHPYMGIYEFRDGKIARMRDYFEL